MQYGMVGGQQIQAAQAQFGAQLAGQMQPQQFAWQQQQQPQQLPQQFGGLQPYGAPPAHFQQPPAHQPQLFSNQPGETLSNIDLVSILAAAGVAPTVQGGGPAPQGQQAPQLMGGDDAAFFGQFPPAF